MTIVFLRAPHGHETPYHSQGLTQATNYRDTLPSADRRLPLKPRKVSLREVYNVLWHKNATIPIATLPAELLVYIFRLANADNLLTDQGKSMMHPSRRRPLPLTISHVSRYWRDVATTCPLLWAEINISPPWSLNLVNLFLERSYPCPIDLSLVVPTVNLGLMSCTLINKHAEALCKVVRPHIPRCQSIFVKGDFDRLEPLLDAFLNMIYAPDAPLLKKVVLQATLEDIEDADFENPFAPVLISGVPSLSELRLSGPMMSSCLLALSQVTSLHLSVGNGISSFRLSYTSFAAMLSACCNNLQTLALYDDIVWGPWPSTPGLATIDLPSLHSLQVYGTFTCVSDLLRVTDAPELEELVIAPVVADDLYEFREEMGDNSGQATRPKFPRLRKLAVSPVSIAGFDLLTIAAECFPAIECLTIPNPHPEALVKHFATLEDSGILWPNLKTFALRSVDRPCMRALEKVVAFRRVMGTPLETIYLDRASAIVSAQSAELRGGVDVIELDAWSQLRDSDPVHHPLQFVGKEFH